MVASKVAHNGRVTTRDAVSSAMATVIDDSVTISIESAQILLNILAQTTLAVGSSDFDDLALGVLTAKRELVNALGMKAELPSEE